MSCKWCVHWVTDNDKYSKTTGIKGQCRRFPSPVETTSDYRCGEFVCEPDTFAKGSNLMQGFFERMHEFSDAHRREKDKRMALEKKMKELRAKLRQNTGNERAEGSGRTQS